MRTLILRAEPVTHTSSAGAGCPNQVSKENRGPGDRQFVRQQHAAYGGARKAVVREEARRRGAFAESVSRGGKASRAPAEERNRRLLDTRWYPR